MYIIKEYYDCSKEPLDRTKILLFSDLDKAKIHLINDFKNCKKDMQVLNDMVQHKFYDCSIKKDFMSYTVVDNQGIFICGRIEEINFYEGDNEDE